MRSSLVGALLTLLIFDDAPAMAAERSSALESVRADIRLKRYSPALDRLGVLARNGDHQAQYLLACALLNGIAAEPDEVAGIRWLKSASDGGNGSAMFVLASILARSNPLDRPQIDTLLAHAAAAGNAAAQEAVKRGSLLGPDREAAMRDPALRRDLILWAIRHNETALLSSLVPVGDVRDAFGTTAVGVAAQAGALESLRFLLGLGVDVNDANRYDVTPLMLAAGADQTDAMELLLTAGADVSRADSAGNVALTYAARADSASGTNVLLAHSASASAVNKAGHTVLDEALALGAARAATALREHGATATVASPGTGIDHAADYTRAGALYKGWSPLWVAISRDDTATVSQLLGTSSAAPGALAVAVQSGAANSARLLLQHGADAGTPDAHGSTPLNMAIRQRNRTLVAELLAAGAGADVHGPQERPPLISATAIGDEAIVASLLAAHARVDATDAHGFTALLVAAGQGQQTIARALLAAGADVAHQDSTGHSALWIASSAGHADLVQLLLGANAGPAGHDHLGVTPLMAASAQGHDAAVAALLAAGADRNSRADDGNTALILAAGAGRVAVVKRLTASQDALNVQNSLGDTALIAASRFGHLDTCRLLIKAGADASLRNASRLTAADIARARGLAEIQALLDAA